MGYLDTESVAALNAQWAQSTPEIGHQTRGDKLRLRLEVRHPSGDIERWTLRIGQGKRVLTSGGGVMPDAVVTLDDETVRRVFTSENPSAITAELAAGTIGIRGNADKLFANLGDVLSIGDTPTRERMRSRVAGGAR